VTNRHWLILAALMALVGCAAPREAVRVRTELAVDTAADLRTAADGIDALVAEELRLRSDQVFAEIAANFETRLDKALLEEDAATRRASVASLAAALVEARAAAHRDLVAWAEQRAAISDSVRVSADAVMAINRMADHEAASSTKPAAEVASVARSRLDAIISESEARATKRPKATTN
jgi:hypothetical protein